MVRKIGLFALVAGMLLLGMPHPVRAAESAALKADILRIAVDWAHIKFLETDKDLQDKQLAALQQQAKVLTQQYPGRPEPQIWLGIIMSERASMASENYSPLKALELAKSARDVLQKAVQVDPFALDAGAPTSLGVLYYRVPAWPIGFGDKARARQLLQEAVTNAPNGLDANYFYGDFLMNQEQYQQAVQIFQHALTIPRDTERPVWDRARRLVIQDDLSKMKTQ